MSREEQLQGSKSGLAGSPVRSRLYGFVGSSPRQELHGSGQYAKKPPEPLRRAVAECLSSSATNVHGSASSFNSEATRTLRDYMSSPSTTDLAYYVLLEHAVSEKERSPAVISRCIVILKRYLLRYVPKVETLRKIDTFCSNLIAECDSSSRSQNTVAKLSNPQTLFLSSAQNFVSPALLKSLHYVQSLVARHIPRLSFPQVTPSQLSNVGTQSLQTLSSLLSRSFNTNLSPETVLHHEIPEIEEIPLLPTQDHSSQQAKHHISDQYIFCDLLKWRWSLAREQQSGAVVTQSENMLRPQGSQIHLFLEAGAAALLGIPDVEELFQPSDVTIAEEVTPSNQHLRAITASKRLRPSPQQFWVNVPVSTFSPRARALFQYRHYSEQQPLRLDPTEISDVMAAVCLDTSSPSTNLMTTTPRLNTHCERPYTDVAVSVLVKLVMDMYLMDFGIATPLTLTMLEDMLISRRVLPRVRAFDIILNLGIHAHLLEPVFVENPSFVGESETSIGFQLSKEKPLTFKMTEQGCEIDQGSSAINDFESWLLIILFENLLLLVQMEEKEEIVWASALSCLFYFVCDGGKIRRNRLEGLDIRVVKNLLEIGRMHSWTQIIRSELICMFANMFYCFSDSPKFLIEQVDLIGELISSVSRFVFLPEDVKVFDYSHATSREERRDLFSLLFDYVLCEINDSCLATGSPSYNFEDVQYLATMLSAAEAPEAFYISIKHGLGGIGGILKGSIASALTRSPNFVHLNLLLEKIASKLGGIISSFTHLDPEFSCIDPEFSCMIRVTRSCKFMDSFDLGDIQSDVSMQAKLSWANLHALIHSERPSCRQKGYVWLVDLLFSEISEGKASILSNIKRIRSQIGYCSGQESSLSSVPLCICIFCGLLNSKVNEIRWGFLFVLEKFLMRCKLLLDEEASDHEKSVTHLEKASAVIDLMSSALTLVFQKNETDRINILKMCEILFSQLCLQVLPADWHSFGDLKGSTGGKIVYDGQFSEAESTIGLEQGQWQCDTSSIAALLLQGLAAVPIQLIARVPTSLFYWPLIQLAGAAGDDIALGLAVGSKGRGNFTGSASDIRAALLLLLIGKCSGDPAAFLEVGGEEFFRELLDDTDSRVAYYAAAFLLKRMMMKEPDKYQRMLQNLIIKAQQCNNEKLLENPYLQLCGILQLSNDLGNLN